MVNPQSRTAKIQRYNLTGLIYVPPDSGESDGGIDRYERVFGSSDLNINDELVITHNLNKNPNSVRVLDENREEIRPDNVRDVDTTIVTAIVINMKSYIPFNNYKLIVTV